MFTIVCCFTDPTAGGGGRLQLRDSDALEEEEPVYQSNHVYA